MCWGIEGDVIKRKTVQIHNKGLGHIEHKFDFE